MLKSELSSDLAAIGLDIRQCLVAVDMGLAFAERLRFGPFST